MEPHPAKSNSILQPNLKGDEPSLPFNFWMLLVATGLLAGLVGGLLMRLLRNSALL